MSYFQITGTITGFNDLMDQLSTLLVGAGWTKTVINAASASGSPLIAGGAQRRIGRHDLYRCNGAAPGAGDPADFWIDIFHRFPQASSNEEIAWSGFHGMTNAGVPKAITSMSQAGTVITANVPSHGLVIGEAIKFNGNSNILQNMPWTNTVAQVVASTPDANNLTINTPVSYANAGSAGGLIWGVYNPFGAYTDAGNTASAGTLGQSITDAAMDIYGIVTDRALLALVDQGGTYRHIILGEVGRDRCTQADERSRAKLAAPVTGDGVTPQIISLDRNCPNLYVTQSVNLLPVDSALPQSVNLYSSALEEFALTAVDSPTQVRGIVSANTYPAGTLFGLVPEPACCGGSAGLVGVANLDGQGLAFAHNIDGTRASDLQGQLATPEAIGDSLEAASDPDARLRFALNRIFGIMNSNDAVLGPIEGCRGVAWDGAWTNQDRFRTGDPALAPAGDYKGFNTVAIGNQKMGIGGGATA